VPAAWVDLTIDANEDFTSDQIEWQDATGVDIDLDTWSARAQVRQRWGIDDLNNPAFITFDSAADEDEPLITLVDGVITLTAPLAVVSLLSWRSPAVWDLLLKPAVGAPAERLARGYAVLLAGVTAP